MAAVLVQEKLYAGGSTAAVQTVSFDSPVSSGNSVILVHEGSFQGSLAVSDTTNGSYGTAVVGRSNAGGSMYVAVYAKHNLSSGGFSAVTIQASSNFNGHQGIFEVSGLSTLAVSGSNDQNSSLYALSSSPLTGTGFACGGLATGSGVGSPTFDPAYVSTGSAFARVARGSSASHEFSNTQCTGRANGAATAQISALAIFIEAGIATVGHRPGMRFLYGLGR